MVFSAASALLLPTVLWAADHQVEMTNKAADGTVMAFEPRVLHVQPGDTVTFILKDKGHNSASIKNAIPDGAMPWNGKINDQISVKIDVPGVYVYQCTPHFAMGMIGAIVAGEPANLEEVKSLKFNGKAKKIVEQIIASIEAEK
ncbi:pseudoazurin [Agrobacterium radiobacter]|uniref:pseudoazurin n=1 Tax=Agrobacterium tumefaciens complex TaxID=1183400 RepID=UPI00068A0DB0|nr:pseudoazurin [Agrobacterium tumefaciens]